MSDDIDVMGPVDCLVIEFPADRANFSGEVARELTSLAERGLVRVQDLLILRKGSDGAVEAVELNEINEAALGALIGLEADRALLLAEEDILAIGEAIKPGSVAAVVVYENRWAGPFGAAVRRAGGQLVANGRIPIQAIVAAIEADATEEGD